MEVYENFEQALAENGEYVTTVRGVSMYPMLRYMMDPILIRPLKEDLVRYDVAVYSKPDRYVVHRVLETHPDHYVIRGDNCLHKEYVPKEAVRGVVIGFWRFGRYIPVTNPLYKAYSRLWVAINPLVRLHHFFARCQRALSRRLRTLSRRLFRSRS